MTRFRDHDMAYKKRKPHRSAFSVHLLDENHTGRNLIPHVENNSRGRTTLKLIEITKHAGRQRTLVKFPDNSMNRVFIEPPSYHETEL